MTRVLAPVSALVLAATVAACSYSYGSSKYDYGPSFERVPGYQPGYGSRSASTSKYDDWRNYQGSFHHGPEQVP